VVGDALPILTEIVKALVAVSYYGWAAVSFLNCGIVTIIVIIDV